MVEYMKAFLEPFQEAPYKAERESGGMYRITNTVSGFSEVVRGYRGSVFMKKLSLDDDIYAQDVWRRTTSAGLKNMLGTYEREE